MAAAKKTPSFEQSLKRLEEIVDKLEGEELALDASLKLFEEGVKLRDEREISVSDAAETQRLLEMLGYSVAQRYQKMREEWHLGGVLTALDHTPIGDFVEFEGSKAAKVARRCGFEVDAAEQRSYIHIYADHLRQHPEAPPQMVFP